jgi:hypothetical protein
VAVQARRSANQAMWVSGLALAVAVIALLVALLTI